MLVEDWHSTFNNLLSLKHRSNQPLTRIGIASDSKRFQLINLSTGALLNPIDMAFPILHGPYGEDGTIQGLFEIANVPYIGSGVFSSAACMNKIITKSLLQGKGIATAKFQVIQKAISPSKGKDIIEDLGLPLIVKPATLGSSIGVNKINKLEDLPSKIEIALQYDKKVIVEEFISGRELEVAILGNNPYKTSIIGEIIPNSKHEFYSYDAKYIDHHGATLKIPAKLSTDQITELQQLASKTCTILNVDGMARVDFFMKSNFSSSKNIFVVNEVNTIPGFTEISMFPKLWAATGITANRLLNELIQLSLQRHHLRESLKNM